MKRFSFLGLLSLLVCNTACETITPEVEPCPEGLPATLSLQVATTNTKTTVSQTQEEDNTLETLDVFVFQNTGAEAADNHVLDAHHRFQGDDLENLTLNCTTGPKIICVVANAHVDNFIGITNLSSFQEQTSLLKNEELASFTMYGETTTTLSVTNSITITIRRLAAKITAKSIKTKFAGTPYEGMELSNVKLYLINAHAEKITYNNQAPATPLIYNEGACFASDVSECAESGLLMDAITTVIDDSGYSTSHHFFCYENLTENLTSCTKLTLQADLNGITYYYPVPVNQIDYGYNAANGHHGIHRNTAYSIGITVTGQGSTDPNEPIVPGSIELTLEAEDWTTIPHFDKEF